MSTSKKSALLIAASLVIAFAWAAGANATLIYPANSSFESPIEATYATVVPTSWTETGSGTYGLPRLNNSTSAPAVGLTGITGNQYVCPYLGTVATGSQTYSQNISGSTIAANTQYQLLWDLGIEPASFNAGYPATPITITLTLGAWNGTTVTPFATATIPGSQLDALLTGGTPPTTCPLTTFSTLSTLPDVSLVGQTLSVSIAAVQTISSRTWSFAFDDVRIVSSSTPEPGSLALLAAGLLGLLCYAWRKRR